MNDCEIIKARFSALDVLIQRRLLRLDATNGINVGFLFRHGQSTPEAD